MGSRWVVVVAVVLLVAGCSGAGGGGDARDVDDGPPLVPGSRAAALVERLGCPTGRFDARAGGDWYAADVRDCQEGTAVRVYGSLTGDDLDRAVRSLEAGDGPGGAAGDYCDEYVDGTIELFLVTGDGWVAVAAGDEAAATTAAELGGERRPDRLPVLGPAPDPFMCLPQDGLMGPWPGGRPGGHAADTAGMSPGSALADRLRCVDGAFTRGAPGDWQGADVVHCHGDLTARIYGSLTAPQRDAALRLLAMAAADAPAGPRGSAPTTGYPPSCADLGLVDGGIHVVAGDTWVVAVAGEDDARAVADTLDGELQPGVMATPPASGYGGSCFTAP